jgi:hypothetical protein
MVEGGNEDLWEGWKVKGEYNVSRDLASEGFMSFSLYVYSCTPVRQ